MCPQLTRPYYTWFYYFYLTSLTFPNTSLIYPCINAILSSRLLYCPPHSHSLDLSVISFAKPLSTPPFLPSCSILVPPHLKLNLSLLSNPLPLVQSWHPSLFPSQCSPLFLTSLIGHEGQRLRRGSLSLAVKHGNSQVIVGVGPEISHQFLLIGPSLNHHCVLWLPGPSGSVLPSWASSGQVDLGSPQTFEISISYVVLNVSPIMTHDCNGGFEWVIFLQLLLLGFKTGFHKHGF